VRAFFDTPLCRKSILDAPDRPTSPSVEITSRSAGKTIVAALQRCKPASAADVPCLRGVGWAPVAFDRNGRFAFAWESMPGDIVEYAFIVPADDLDGRIIDVAAWLPGRPPATWTGRAPLLGGRNVYAPRPQLQVRLAVHKSISDWLAADQEGIFILDPRAAADWLEGVSLITAGGRNHASMLNRLLTRPAPSIAFAEAAR
jgi:hypothetical protein